jgi:hypothetical protein
MSARVHRTSALYVENLYVRRKDLKDARCEVADVETQSARVHKKPAWQRETCIAEGRV